MFEKGSDVIKDFFKTRRIGFYFTVVAVVLALVQLIIYSVAFNDVLYVQYRSTAAIVCSSLAIVLGVLLSCTHWTERCAPAAVALLELLAFLDCYNHYILRLSRKYCHVRRYTCAQRCFHVYEAGEITH